MSAPVVRFTTRGQDSDPPVPRGFTVIYDGNCKVCSRLADLLQKWDREGILLVVPSQTPWVRTRFPWIPEQNFRESLQVIAADGRAFQGARGVEELIQALPKGRLISWIFNIPFMRPLAERFYRLFARNRYKLGCGEHCTYRPEG